MSKDGVYQRVAHSNFCLLTRVMLLIEVALSEDISTLWSQSSRFSIVCFRGVVQLFKIVLQEFRIFPKVLV